MLFNSINFLIFLAVVLPLYYALTRPWQNRLLLIASYFFGSSPDRVDEILGLSS